MSSTSKVGHEPHLYRLSRAVWPSNAGLLDDIIAIVDDDIDDDDDDDIDLKEGEKRSQKEVVCDDPVVDIDTQMTMGEAKQELLKEAQQTSMANVVTQMPDQWLRVAAMTRQVPDHPWEYYQDYIQSSDIFDLNSQILPAATVPLLQPLQPSQPSQPLQPPPPPLNSEFLSCSSLPSIVGMQEEGFCSEQDIGIIYVPVLSWRLLPPVHEEGHARTRKRKVHVPPTKKAWLTLDDVAPLEDRLLSILARIKAGGDTYQVYRT